MPKPFRLMDIALRLAQAGFFVFPLRRGDKRPLPAFTRWEDRASRNPDTITSWWLEAPYNIGVATGPSGLLVVDCDTARGAEPPAGYPQARGGLDVLVSRARRLGYELPATFSVATPSGGLHLYFRAPPNKQLGNTAGRLDWRIDTRGIGGYVVGPGSVYAGRYYMVRHHVPVAPLPNWISDALMPAVHTMSTGSSAPEHPGSSYLRAIIDGEAEHIRTARPGSRNHALNVAAFVLGRLVGGGELTEQVARNVLSAAASRHIGVHGFTKRELDRTLASGLAAGIRRPRALVEPGVKSS
jgi:bifunctional DNA primase/polymerase-like protein